MLLHAVSLIRNLGLLLILRNIFGHKIVAVTLLTTLNQLVQLLTLKKETVANSYADVHD